ncbi:UNVERIFIED_CONTAM: hypothetical protein RMT77_001983 [Armadillidium vulgare]
MGNKLPVFTDEQLDEYQACTFLTRKDIIRAMKLFRILAHGRLPEQVSRDDTAFVRVDFTALETITELRENPFRRRMCEVFSTDGSASMSFDQFLEMFSVFSEECPREIKAIYAFRIYDFDDDGFIGKEDLTNAVKHLTHDLLHVDEVSSIVDKVLEESDIDCDGKLSQSEFTHAILKSPDFVPNFHIRI